MDEESVSDGEGELCNHSEEGEDGEDGELWSEEGEDGELCDQSEEGEDGEDGELCDQSEEGEDGELCDKSDDTKQSEQTESEMGDRERELTSHDQEPASFSPDIVPESLHKVTDDIPSDHESLQTSVCTVSTTTSYLHGDRATVKRLVARGLKKKERAIHRRVRPKKEAKAAAGTKRNGTSNKKSALKWSLVDSEF